MAEKGAVELAKLTHIRVEPASKMIIHARQTLRYAVRNATTAGIALQGGVPLISSNLAASVTALRLSRFLRPSETHPSRGTCPRTSPAQIVVDIRAASKRKRVDTLSAGAADCNEYVRDDRTRCRFSSNIHSDIL